MTRKVDTKIGLITAGIGLVTFACSSLSGSLIGHPIYLGILGFIVASWPWRSSSDDGPSAQPSGRWRDSRALRRPC